jgi:putative membrane protein insertion efficiency factor
MGMECRHAPSCSEYALEAIDKNGAWKGFWLMLSRIGRCHPWGTHGYDPVPDLSNERHLFAPWRYGRWRRVSAPSEHAPKAP